MMKNQRSDAEKDKLIENSKRIGINEIMRQNNGNIDMINISIEKYRENCVETKKILVKSGVYKTSIKC